MEGSPLSPWLPAAPPVEYMPLGHLLSEGRSGGLLPSGRGMETDLLVSLETAEKQHMVNDVWC